MTTTAEMTEPEVQDLAARLRAAGATVYVVDTASSRNAAELQEAIGRVVPLAPALSHVGWDALADSLSGAIVEWGQPGVDTDLVLGPLNVLEEAEHDAVLGLIGVLEQVEAGSSGQARAFRACLWWRAPAKTGGYCSDRRLSDAGRDERESLENGDRAVVRVELTSAELKLSFDTGAALIVALDGRFESFTLTGPAGELVVG